MLTRLLLLLFIRASTGVLQTVEFEYCEGEEQVFYFLYSLYYEIKYQLDPLIYSLIHSDYVHTVNTVVVMMHTYSTYIHTYIHTVHT